MHNFKGEKLANEASSLFQVNFINAHATSTLAGDLAEINAVKKVFKNTSDIKINSTKVPSLSLPNFAKFDMTIL